AILKSFDWRVIQDNFPHSQSGATAHGKALPHFSQVHLPKASPTSHDCEVQSPLLTYSTHADAPLSQPQRASAPDHSAIATAHRSPRTPLQSASSDELIGYRQRSNRGRRSLN